MKNFIKLAISVLLAVTSSVAMAGEVAGVTYTDNSISESQLLAAAKSISAKALDSATTLQNSAAANNANSATPAAAAIGITAYQIMGVESPNYSNGQIWEPINGTQTSTIQNHGGAWIGVAVFQYGYGNPNNATLAGYLGTHVKRSLVCGPLSAPYFCSVGETATGFVDYFQFNGPQGGSYTSSASSVAYPYGTWTDSLYIK
jgi:hypothetical protein